MNAPDSNDANSASGRKRRNRKRRNRTNAKAVVEYWGDKDALPAPTSDIRITREPAAMIRSLGRPPLSGHEGAAEAYFDAVFARAVGLASALAAAGEMVEPAELLEG